ncbi:flagellar hook-associated protein FlgK [Athalassotoga saccharophila]|uniref:flagellar hook-associated protein FlgK n=1 Tax=Athalassotoga saccharophila TaxID=1441386 RepID=UPI001E531DCC|nr:flagellar hook-associated protein FlgK [Athalassotoga saccharophila]
MDLFATLNTAMLGMYTQQTAISVVANNVSNANTPGYSRESPVIVQTPPMVLGTLTQAGMPMIFGTGAEVKDIQRIRDPFLDTQYRQSNSSLGFWNEVNTQFQYIEQLFNTTNSNGLNAYYNNFWSAAQQLATNPTNVANQEGFVQSAKALIDNVKSVYSSLEQMKTNYTSQIQTQVGNINSILKQIADLNVKIRESSVIGNTPNQLLDQRDLLLDQLSNLTDFTITNMSGNQISINIGGTNVLSGQTYVPLNFQNVAGEPNAAFVTANNQAVTFSQGEMGALFNLRDKLIPQYETQLNSFALNLVDKVNTILTQSYDQNGNLGQPLFTIQNAAGQPTSLYRIMSSNPPSGVVYDPSAPIGNIFSGLPSSITLNVNGAFVNINTSVDTLSSIVSKINNANVGIEASLSPRGNLVLRATSAINFDLMRTNPNGMTNPVSISESDNGVPGNALLDKLGFQTNNYSIDLSSYSNNPNGLEVPVKDAAMSISVNPILISNPSYVATDFSPVFNGNPIGTVGPTGPQGNGGIEQIVSLDSDSNPQSFSAYFSNLVSQLGIQGQNATAMYNNANSLVNQISQDRKQVSSVSINDELAQMILYQNAYTASAQVISTVNSMLQTLVSMVG